MPYDAPLRFFTKTSKKQLKIAVHIPESLGNNNIRAHGTALNKSAPMLLLNIDKTQKEKKNAFVASYSVRTNEGIQNRRI